MCPCWRPPVVLALYVDSFAFVFGTAFLKFGIGLERSPTACDGAILLCLVAYVSTKVSRSSRWPDSVVYFTWELTNITRQVVR